jgi:hypothetical protein
VNAKAQLNAVADEVPQHALDRSQSIIQIEDKTHDSLHLFIGVHAELASIASGWVWNVVLSADLCQANVRQTKGSCHFGHRF